MEPLEEWERELLETEAEEPEDTDVTVVGVSGRLWITMPYEKDEKVRVEFVDNHWVLPIDKETAVKLVYALSEYLK